MDSQQNRGRVAIIHTNLGAFKDMDALFREMAPDVEVRHIVDDSLLPDVRKAGGITEPVAARIRHYYESADLLGVDVILNQCSSVGDVADSLVGHTRARVVRVDRRMAEKAIDLGSRIGVIATVPTTIAPSSALLRRVAGERGKTIEIVERVVDGAFDVLSAGDREGHNEMVVAAIRELDGEVDVIVCAQGSMAAIVADLDESSFRAPILTSPRLGVENVLEALAEARD